VIAVSVAIPKFNVPPGWGGTAATLSAAKPAALDPPNSAATAKASDGHARGATSLTQADGCRPRAFRRPLQKADKACRNIYDIARILRIGAWAEFKDDMMVRLSHDSDHAACTVDKAFGWRRILACGCA
jgi:hypothetical protein